MVRKILIKCNLYYKYKGQLYPEYLSYGNAASHISDLAKELVWILVQVNGRLKDQLQLKMIRN